ncbi:phage tail tube protein [Paracoccus sp. S1E-3]|uniref:phage tail tube protein n=1 Tax=Paracoccus sp. S1E-3 TaxID=2756130 RepID=UPI0015EECCF7|nr:phage tail tube protein [Paracoccus sp. S1E-3]MBA4492413.1 hypothetical protein [Paracoccus sp. S1E-3]
MARAWGARAQMALAFETVYGTPPVDGFTKMPFASTTLGAEQPLLNSELLGYANNLDRIETIRGDGRVDSADPSIAALTGSIEVRFADSALVTQAMDCEACELDFSYAPPSGESFAFTVHAVYLPRPRIESSGPEGVQATFEWQAARDSTLGRICTAMRA